MTAMSRLRENLEKLQGLLGWLEWWEKICLSLWAISFLGLVVLGLDALIYYRDNGFIIVIIILVVWILLMIAFDHLGSASWNLISAPAFAVAIIITLFIYPIGTKYRFWVDMDTKETTLGKTLWRWPFVSHMVPITQSFDAVYTADLTTKDVVPIICTISVIGLQLKSSDLTPDQLHPSYPDTVRNMVKEALRRDLEDVVLKMSWDQVWNQMHIKIAYELTKPLLRFVGNNPVSWSEGGTIKVHCLPRFRKH